MSGSGAGHVRLTSLEPDLGTRYVRSRTLSLKNWVRSDISGLGAGHVRKMPLESGLEDIYAWLTQEKAERPDMSGLGPDMSCQSLWNPARGPDMSGLT
jgi:hypothetical protein